MKITAKNLTTAATTLISLGILTANAQVVTPTTTDVELFCEGSNLELGTAPAGRVWMVRFSTTPGNDTPEETVPLTDGTTIPAALLKNGYYYISIDGDTSNPEVCESVPTEIPVYVFKPLTVDFVAADYCIEDAAGQTFTAEPTTTDAHTTYAYQWFTVDGTTETAISGATAATYTPDPAIPAGTTTTYRLKAGYLVGTLAYCSQQGDNDVTVTAKPAKPTITVSGGATGETL